MKFICYRKDLNDALLFAIKAVAVKPMTPVLAGIYLKAEGAILELQSNNFSTAITVQIPVKVNFPGETVVSGKRFLDFVRGMSGEMLTLSDEDDPGILAIKSSDDTNVELLTMNTQEFPKVKPIDADKTFKIRMKTFRRLIRRTIFAASKDESRPVFTGCCLEVKDDIISLIATNTHRIAIAKEPLQNHVDECSFIIPAESLRSIMSRINPNENDNDMLIGVAPRYLTFTFENVLVTSRLIEGQFPPYDRVIPQSSNTQVIVPVEKFRNAVEFIALMSKETEFNTIKFSFHDNKIEISSNSPEVGDAKKIIDGDITGDGLDISFNVDYISDVLKIIDGEKVKIEFSDRYSPCAFTELNDDNYIYVATPVRT